MYDSTQVTEDQADSSELAAQQDKYDGELYWVNWDNNSIWRNASKVAAAFLSRRDDGLAHFTTQAVSTGVGKLIHFIATSGPPHTSWH